MFAAVGYVLIATLYIGLFGVARILGVAVVDIGSLPLDGIVWLPRLIAWLFN